MECRAPGDKWSSHRDSAGHGFSRRELLVGLGRRDSSIFTTTGVLNKSITENNANYSREADSQNYDAHSVGQSIGQLVGHSLAHSIPPSQSVVRSLTHSIPNVHWKKINKNNFKMSAKWPLTHSTFLPPHPASQLTQPPTLPPSPTHAPTHPPFLTHPLTVNALNALTERLSK